MIERYSRKEIKSIWEDYNRYSIWLKIELAAAEAMEKLRIIPRGVVKKVKLKAKINPKRFLITNSAIGSISVSSIIGLQQLWYSNDEDASFHFFDDSKKNLKDVKQLRQLYPQIKDIQIKHVVKGDILSLENKDA